MESTANPGSPEFAGHQNFTNQRRCPALRRRPVQTKRKHMPARSRTAKSRPAARAVPRLGALPEWNLADLYAGIDDPQVKRDLERGAAESLTFEQAYKGKLATL